MNGISRRSGWVVITVLIMLASCATEPYYEAAPISPSNVTPVDDVNIAVNASTTFSWLPTENTQFYEFHIYNQTTKDTTQYRHNQLQEESVCSEGRCSLTLNVDLPTTTGHAWRVRAGNNAGLSEWNRTRFNMISASGGASNEETAVANAQTGNEEATEASAETSNEEITEINAEANADANNGGITEASAESGTRVDLSTVTQISASEESGASDAAVVNPEVLQSVELVTNADESADSGASAVASSDTQAQALVKSNTSSDENGPDLLQPVEDSQVITGSLVDFKWRSLPDAISYDFFIYDSVSKEMVESLTGIKAVSLCPSDNVCGLTREVLLPEANHSWRVRANYEDGASPFSSNRFAVIN